MITITVGNNTVSADTLAAANRMARAEQKKQAAAEQQRNQWQDEAYEAAYASIGHRRDPHPFIHPFTPRRPITMITITVGNNTVSAETLAGANRMARAEQKRQQQEEQQRDQWQEEAYEAAYASIGHIVTRIERYASALALEKLDSTYIPITEDSPFPAVTVTSPGKDNTGQVRVLDYASWLGSLNTISGRTLAVCRVWGDSTIRWHAVGASHGMAAWVPLPADLADQLTLLYQPRA
jgi:uncharacterized FlaG/YvyC family protein